MGPTDCRRGDMNPVLSGKGRVGVPTVGHKDCVIMLLMRGNNDGSVRL